MAFFCAIYCSLWLMPAFRWTDLSPKMWHLLWWIYTVRPYFSDLLRRAAPKMWCLSSGSPHGFCPQMKHFVLSFWIMLSDIGYIPYSYSLPRYLRASRICEILVERLCYVSCNLLFLFRLLSRLIWAVSIYQISLIWIPWTCSINFRLMIYSLVRTPFVSSTTVICCSLSK